MVQTKARKGEPGAWVRSELARIMIGTMEPYLRAQVTELQIDLAEAGLAQAGPRRAASIAKERRERTQRRIRDLEARLARQCQLVAMQAAAGRDSSAGEALLRDLEQLLLLARIACSLG
jgi:hypothetical protein